MDHQFRTKSDLYVFAGYILLALAVGINYFTIPFLQGKGFFPVLNSFNLHDNDFFIYLPTTFNVICIVTGLIMIRGRMNLKFLINNSFAYNLFLLVGAFVILFGINGISPGRFKIIRIVLVLAMIFLLTNCLYLLVIKKRKDSVHNFYKNMALVIYSLFFIFLILEIVFMFFAQSHRYNGSLSSRSWFYKYYDLNSEGYRDREYDWEAEKGKTKIMVLGDSFVEGHGIEDPEERFSNVLAHHLPESYGVYNLGHGGSDVKDGLARLKEYPLVPELLVFSYYPNDMENDCQEAGMELARIAHMGEVPGIFRYFVKRSYLINYIYWQYPHGSDLFNYQDYLAGCYSDSTALGIHLGHLDSMRNYTDSLGIQMVTVIWPFLEAIDSTRFAADPIVNYLDSTGGFSLDVGAMLHDRPVEDLIVNLNDAHANEAVHKEVGDSLYRYLKNYGMLME